MFLLKSTNHFADPHGQTKNSILNYKNGVYRLAKISLSD